MDRLYLRLLSGAAAVIFALAYSGPLMLCGEACAGDATAVMACCSGTADGVTSAVAHKCCCDITQKGGEAIPSSTPAPYSGPDAPDYPATGASADAGSGFMPVTHMTAPVPSSFPSTPLYVQSCSYLC